MDKVANPVEHVEYAEVREYTVGRSEEDIPDPNDAAELNEIEGDEEPFSDIPNITKINFARSIIERRAPDFEKIISSPLPFAMLSSLLTLAQDREVTEDEEAQRLVFGDKFPTQHNEMKRKELLQAKEELVE